MKIFLLFLYILSTNLIAQERPPFESEIKYLVRKTGNEAHKITRLALLENPSQLKAITASFEIPKNFDAIKCLKALKTKYVSLAQLQLCSIIDSNTLDNILIQEEIKSKECDNSNLILNNQQIKTIHNDLLKEKLTIGSLFYKYHCSCNPDSLSCLNNAYYCGELYDQNKSKKMSYEDLEKSGHFNEIIGKSISDINLRSRSCYLKSLSEKLPNEGIEKVLKFALRSDDVKFKPVPNFTNPITNILELKGKCSPTKKQEERITNLIRNNDLHKIINSNNSQGEKERLISRAINGISSCHDKYTDFLEQQIQSRNLKKSTNSVKDNNTLLSGTHDYLYPQSKIKLSPIAPTNICTEELYKNISKHDSNFKKKWEAYIDESKEILNDKLESIKSTQNAINRIEETLFSEDSVSKYLKCSKYKEKFKALWTQDTSKYTHFSKLNKLKKECSGYTEYYDQLGRDYKDLIRKQSQEYKEYRIAKSKYFQRLHESEGFIENNINQKVEDNALIFNHLFPRDSIFNQQRDHLISQVEVSSNESDIKFIHYNQIEKELFKRQKEEQLKKLNKVSTYLEDATAPRNKNQKLIHITIGNDSIEGLLNGSLELISAPVEAVGNLINNTINETTNFVSYHTEKFRIWISDKPVQNLANNTILKAIAWIACGGKLPYDHSMTKEEKEEDAEYRRLNGLPKRKEGKCVEGGIQGDSNGNLTLLDKFGNPSVRGVNREIVITAEQLAFMRKWDLHDSLQEEDFFKHLREWVANEEAQKSIFQMLSERNSQILKDLNNPNLTDRERLESYQRASRHLSIVEAIRFGTEGAAQAVKDSYYDLIAVAENPEKLVKALDALYDAGLDGTLSVMGNAIENYWNDYQAASPEEKAKIVGYISGEIAMALIPAGGALKGATGLVTKAGKTSKFLSSTKLLLDTTIGKFGEQAAKDFIKIAGNANGTFKTPQELANAIKKIKYANIWTKGQPKSILKNVNRHFNDHGKEFNMKNPIEYVEFAHEFMSNPPQGTLIKHRSNGDKLFYNPKTNTFAVQSKDGIPKTIFKPKNKMEYWQNQ